MTFDKFEAAITEGYANLTGQGALTTTAASSAPQQSVETAIAGDPGTAKLINQLLIKSKTPNTKLSPEEQNLLKVYNQQIVNRQKALVDTAKNLQKTAPAPAVTPTISPVA
jgi:hypothetical protein